MHLPLRSSRGNKSLAQLDRSPLGAPQPGLDRDSRLFPDHLMAALVRVEETEEQHRAHIGYHAVARALGDYASAQLTERLLARGVEREMVEPTTLEKRLLTRRLDAWHLEG